LQNQKVWYLGIGFDLTFACLRQAGALAFGISIIMVCFGLIPAGCFGRDSSVIGGWRFWIFLKNSRIQKEVENL
jgi:hypothetical protein